MSKEILAEFEFAKSIAWQIEPSQDLVYVLNNENQKWYFFREISKDIWLQINQNKSLNIIVKMLMKEYEVDYETLYNDVKNFICELQEEGLVTHNG